MDVRETAVRHAFAEQAGNCERLGSPFMALLMRVVGRRVLDRPGELGAEGGNLPLRLAGGLHALVRRCQLPELARLYLHGERVQ